MCPVLIEKEAIVNETMAPCMLHFLYLLSAHTIFRRSAKQFQIGFRGAAFVSVGPTLVTTIGGNLLLSKTWGVGPIPGLL